MTGSRRGYAMMLMMVALLVMTSLSVVVMASTTRDYESSRLSTAKAEARLQAASVLEDFFSRVSTDPIFAQDVTLAARGEPGRRTKYQTIYPALSFSTLPSVDAVAENSWAGAKMTKMGLEVSSYSAQPTGEEPCPNDATKYEWDCFSLTVESSPTSDVMTVTATTRVRCAGNYLKCVTVSLSQRLRKVQYYDFLVSQEYTTVGLAAGLLPVNSSFTVGEVTGQAGLSSAEYEAQCSDKKASERPGYCLSIAYLGSSTTPEISDMVQGPLYSADDYIYVCGNPLSDGGQSAFTNVSLSGPGNSSLWYKQQCPPSTPTTPTYVTLNHPVLKLPSNSSVSADALLGLNVVSLSAPVVLIFENGGVHVSQSGGPFGFQSYDGKVFEVSNGSAGKDVTIKGSINGRVSIVSRGDAAIVGDLSYACSDYASCDDFLSLTTSDSLEVWQECGSSSNVSCIPVSQTCPPVPSLDPCIELPDNLLPSSRVYDRKVDGILVSLNSFVGTPDWYTNTNPVCPLPSVPVGPPPPSQSCRPTLKFTGSITSKYQGVFGAYDSSNGQLVGGFYKKFVHDPRLKTGSTNYDMLPPYTVTSLVAVWTRLDLLEVSTR